MNDSVQFLGVPEVNSVWKIKDSDDFVTVLDVKKRGRGYRLITSIGAWRLKDFQRSVELQVIDTL